MLRRLKLGPKLIAAFAGIAVVGAITGTIGYRASNELGRLIGEVGVHGMQGIEALSKVEYCMACMVVGERGLANDAGEGAARDAQYAFIDKYFDASQDAFKEYDAIEKSDKEKKDWEEFRGLWDQWHDESAKIIAIHKDIDHRMATRGLTFDDDEIDSLHDQTKSMSYGKVRDAFVAANAKAEEMLAGLSSDGDALVTRAQARTRSALMGIAAAVIIGLLLSIVCGTLIARSLARPVSTMAKAAHGIANGDMNQDISYTSGDEIGTLADAFRTLISNLTGIVTDIQTATDQVAEGSATVSSASEQLSSGATEQAANIEEVSSSIEEMNSSVNQNADNAQQTTAIAEKTAADAQEGGRAVGETVSAMKEIAQRISIIEEIARQTNLLALNAAIEAARAGEHGRGFAVVATEVRKLAERSGTAAQEIGALSTNSVEIAEKAGQLLDAIVPGIRRTAELVQEINASSSEQSRGVAQITQAIQQLDGVIQQNASGSEELASTSQELSSQAEQLRDVLGFFKLKAMGMARRPAASVVRKPEPVRFSTDETGVLLELADDDDGSFERQSA